MADTRARRCAIYTRKSSEEGLEQDYNSLREHAMGEIRHGSERYPGQQKAIVSREPWERVQQQLRSQAAPAQIARTRGFRAILR